MKRLLLLLFISTILFSFMKKVDCVDKLFLGYDINSSAKKWYNSTKNNRAFKLYTNKDNFTKDNEFQATFLKRDGTYSDADSIQIIAGNTPEADQTDPAKSRDLKFLKIILFVKDEAIRDSLYQKLKYTTCKSVDFNNQRGTLKNGLTIKAAGHIFFLTKKFFPHVEFFKNKRSRRFTLEVMYTDYE